MARYYLHLRDHSEQILDPEGLECADENVMRETVLESVRDLIAGDAREGAIDLRFRIDAEDQAGRIVHSLPFEDAVTIQRGR